MRRSYVNIVSILISVVAAVSLAMYISLSDVKASSLESKEIEFQRIVNARDIGGWRTKDKRRVKKGLILRCDELSFASSGDITKLRSQYRLKTIVDLRYKTDGKYCPDKKIKGARYHLIPAAYSRRPGKTAPKERYKKLKKKSDRALVRHEATVSKKVGSDYTRRLVMSPYSRKQYRKLFKILLKGDGQRATLIHCVHGKDRTGVAAFMTLIALGVDEKAALREYSLTNDYISKVVSDKSAVKKLGVRKSDLKSAVDEAKKKYGSLKEFLRKAYGLSDAKIKKLRRIYVE